MSNHISKLSRQIAIIILLATGMITMPQNAFGQLSSQSAKPTDRMAKSVAAKQETVAKRVEALQAKANREIDRRVTSLQEVVQKIGTIEKLSDSTKATLSAQVKTEILNLQTLKTKIAGDTDITTLKTDIQSIIGSYRVYLLFVPQIRLLITANLILEAGDKFDIYIETLQLQIQSNNQTALQPTLSDMQTRIANAQKLSQDAIDMVTPLTPDGYPANKTTLEKARKMLQAARADLQIARRDAQIITQGLKTRTTVTSPAPSITVTTTPVASTTPTIVTTTTPSPTPTP